MSSNTNIVNLSYNKLSLAVALSFAAANTVQAQFSNPVNLSSIDGNNGFVINGVNTYDSSGNNVTTAGDINGDGIDDMIISANFTNYSTNLHAGSVYIVFGSLSGFPQALNLSSLDGNNGFVFNGENDGDLTGNSISSAGDINGDGIDDIIIGAYGYDPAGSAYVIFGQSSGFSGTMKRSDLNGINGFVINGQTANDKAGYSVSSAGDINGDNIDDMIVGAARASPNAQAKAGSSYVIFGSSAGFPNPLNLGNINGPNGFVINGENVGDAVGRSVSAAGDINGDTIDDLIIGAPNADSKTGKSYIVFGSSNSLPSPLNLSNINVNTGVVILGEDQNDASGVSVSAAGDINGDGVDDVIIGSNLATNTNSTLQAGSAYVIFGNSTSLPTSLNLSTIDGTNGFVIHGENTFDIFGQSVSSAGDVNGDGVDDLIVGALFADPNTRNKSGSSYVIYGSSSGLPNPLKASDLNGSNGFIINGVNIHDYSGVSVSSAGDINGDGINDVIIGAKSADPNNISGAGSSYVLFGRNKNMLFNNGFEFD